MAKLSFKLKTNKNLTKQFTTRTEKTTTSAIKVIGQDLARTSSGATPHFKGDLEGSYSVEYNFSSSKFTASVEYAVYNNGFNYAIAMHEWKYKLGEKSEGKAGGKGMSGRTYPVGRKFLTRVLEGESKAYRDYVKTKLEKIMD